jgi:DNA-binding XRE family transcriptional regulator
VLFLICDIVVSAACGKPHFCFMVTRSFVRANVFLRFRMFSFSEHLKAIRKSRNITQKQLAEAIGASERGIQNYEIGARKPTYDMLIALADYFNVSTDYLLGRSDTP